MLRLAREVAQGIRDKYEEKRKDGDPYCMFATVKIKEDMDQWEGKPRDQRIPRVRGCFRHRRAPEAARRDRVVDDPLSA
ncbi:MAG: hypothetical protein ABSH28_13995 [Acidobacteriota bacterium]|jgi:hypothetical protein